MTKVDEKDVLREMPVRDLLKMAEPALNNFMLLAVVESGNSPAACFDVVSKCGVGAGELATAVKAAVWARIRLGDEWDKMKTTSVRPAESMLRFDRPWPNGVPVPSTHLVFGNRAIDQHCWPLLLREFLVPNPTNPAAYLTTLDYEGHVPFVHKDPSDLFFFLPCSEHWFGGAKFGSWKVSLREYWTLWTKGDFQVYTTTMMLEPYLRKERFPKCFKVVEISQRLEGNEWERVRITVQLDQRSYPESALVFQKLTFVSANWEAKLSVPFQLCHPISGEAVPRVGFAAHFNQYLMQSGFYSVSCSDQPSLSDRPSPPFHLRATGKDPYPEFAELAERISAVGILDLEPICGQAFLDNPPEHLHDLFLPK